MARNRKIVLLSTGTFVLAVIVGIGGFLATSHRQHIAREHGSRTPAKNASSIKRTDTSLTNQNKQQNAPDQRGNRPVNATNSAVDANKTQANAALAGKSKFSPNNQGTIVSLGDSITYGFNLPGATMSGTHPSPDAYPYVLGKMMHANVIDLGVPRWTTDNLIAALKTEPYRTALHQATLVTVDIGSNDLLHAFSDVLADYLQGKEPGSLQPTIAQLQINIAKLPKQLTTIIRLIRQNTNAPIALTTIYDPSPDNTSIHDFTNRYIVEANRVILREAASSHTLLYDAYDTMNHQQWALVRIMHFDIHPTIAGQQALAGGFDAMWQDKDWNEPTRYVITQNGAAVYSQPSANANTIGKITGIAGYVINSTQGKWDEISFGQKTGYVLRKNIDEIIRYEATAMFSRTHILSHPIEWQLPNGTVTDGFMVNHQYYVPVSALAKMANGMASWNNTQRLVEMTVPDPTSALTRAKPRIISHSNLGPTPLTVEYLGIGVEINGELVHLTSEPFSYDSNIYVPVDPIWTQLGGQINLLNGRFSNNP